MKRSISSVQENAVVDPNSIYQGSYCSTDSLYGTHSFSHHRRFRITKNQRYALENIFHKWAIPYQRNYIDYKQEFDRSAPIIVEIGFGMGEATEQIALDRPNENFLAIETYPPGVGSLIRKIETSEIRNLRIIRCDAIKVFEDMIAPKSLSGVHIYFPDPWPKARHRKRRLIKKPFAQLITSRLRDNGYIHCATDSKEYAIQISDTLSSFLSLLSSCKHGYSIKHCYNRPVTKFENRGIKLGHNIYDFVFKHVG